ncbi:MAG: hypothetical protein ACT4N7_18480, partial [Actinokineospora sp.]
MSEWITRTAPGFAALGFQRREATTDQPTNHRERCIVTHAPNIYHPHKSRIPCTDGFDRERSVGLWAAPTSGRVVLVAPPAETALFTPAQAR